MSSSPPRAVVRAPDFPAGLDWITADGDAPDGDAPDGDAPRTLAALRGKVVVVDIWTYGCINCQHVAPLLRALERRHAPALAVVGVHSGKFIAERVTARIAHAAARLGAHHPAVNDRQFRLWRAWAARGWPTLAVLDPRGRVLWQAAGEPRARDLDALVARAVADAAADGTLDPAPRPWQRAHPPAAAPTDALRYPSAVAWAPADDGGPAHLAVADAGHHRVLVGRLTDGGRALRVAHRAGAGERARDRHPALDGLGETSDGDSLGVATRVAFAALADGPPGAATFDRPQGLAFGRDALGRPALYVADTGNHAVRAVDAATGAVRTVAGTGVRLRTAADRRAGAMASPWGVLATGAPAAGGARPALLVAMAGTHELWRVDPATGDAGPTAGGRGEGLADGPPGDALLAQPAALATDGRRLWWTDAESSAVREGPIAALAGPAPGAVRTLVGTGLFDFGDADGAGDAARLQHPQGLAWVPNDEGGDGGRLLVVDSYNDALRWLDPRTRELTTFVRGLAEPGGLAVGGGVAYVADTNAHRVAVVDLRTGEVGTLRLE